MFALPSLSNLVVSTIVFFIAAWYVRRYLDEQGIPKGMTRGILVFAIASLLSWGAGAAVDWVQGQSEGPEAAIVAPDDLSRLLKAAGQVQ